MTYILHADIKRNNPYNYCPEPDHLSKQEHKYYKGSQPLIKRKMVNDGFQNECWFIKGKVSRQNGLACCKEAVKQAKCSRGNVLSFVSVSMAPEFLSTETESCLEYEHCQRYSKLRQPSLKGIITALSVYN